MGRLLMPLISAALAATGLAIPQEAKAWGEFGHLTVCDLAYRNFTPTTRELVKDLFAGGATITAHGETRTYTSFNFGCLEEDERPRKKIPRIISSTSLERFPRSRTTFAR